eukprot:TRINITY_DN55272_c0_g1_i1.p1 TRINITY_DN55272_c0_g1~~TRINITY_DN55272_c0_g1_i1.p1  ORF type:complete len:1898 (+),score=398.70 TRINITY_DN55272_c0_g1_i1:66-5759(+)
MDDDPENCAFFDAALHSAVRLDIKCYETSHADFLLRRLGLIRQKGKVYRRTCFKKSKRNVFYDALHHMWQDADTQEPLPDCFELQVVERSDEVPGGVIRVVGDAAQPLQKRVTSRKVEATNEQLTSQLEQISTYIHTKQQKELADEKRQEEALSHLDAKQADREVQQAERRQKEEHERAKRLLHGKRNPLTFKDIPRVPLSINQAGGLETANTLVDALEDDPEFIADKELASFLKQFLKRSIPRAAKKLGAVVITEDYEDLGRRLAEGMMKPTDGNQAGAAALVGVFPLHKPIANHDQDDYNQRSLLSVPSQRDLPEGFTHCVEVTKAENRSEPASDAAVGVLVQGLALELAHGFIPEVHKLKSARTKSVHKQAGNREPPRRTVVPAVTIVYGGDDTRKFEVIQSVRHSWPILVVEGSGGFADLLASTINRMEKESTGNIDDYRKFLGKEDATIAEIINSGCCRVVKKGTSAEMMERMIETALKGNETLRTAWSKYAVWNHNAKAYQRMFRLLQVLILSAGLMATTLSIFQTFLQLQFPEDTVKPDTAAQAKRAELFVVYQVLNWVVIAFPIAISLLQAVANKLNAGAKWVGLRGAAEGCLKEIYCYRTNTLSYSKSAIAAATEKAKIADSMEPAENKYTSRDERLHIRLEQLTQRLSESEVAEVTLTPYTGPIPPTSILRDGEDGMRDLTPDEYVRVRLRPMIKWYQDNAMQLRVELWYLSLMNYVFGAGGTLLAALAVSNNLVKYNLQSWVALTTAIVTALTRYVDYTRNEWRHKKFNKVAHALTNMETWWSARGPNADVMTNRDTLVQETEQLVSEEVTEWEHQLKTAIEEMKKAQEQERNERESLINAIKNREDIGPMAELREMGFATLGPSDFAKALSDPTGPTASKLREMMGKLDEKLKVEEMVQQTETGRQIISTVKEVADVVANNAIAKEVLTFVQDTSHRQKFLAAVTSKSLDPLGLTRQDILEMAKASGRVLEKSLKEMGHDEIMKITKEMALQEMAKNFFDSMRDLRVDSLTELESLAHRSLEDFVGELRNLAQQPWGILQREHVVSLVVDPLYKQTLAQFQTHHLRAALKRAERFFLNPADPLVQMFDALTNEVVDLGVDQLLPTATERLQALADVVKAAEKIPYAIELVHTTELLELVPSFKNLSGLSRAELLRCYSYLSNGSTGWRHLQQIKTLFKVDPSSLAPVSRPATTVEYVVQAGISLFSLIDDRVSGERFVHAASYLTQQQVNSFSKPAIVKRMSLSPVFNSADAEILLQVNELQLKNVLSILGARRANSFTGQIFDRLADDIMSLDLRTLFVDYETRMQLVTRAFQFREVDLDKLDRKGISMHVGFKSLVDVFNQMQEEDLRDLLKRLVGLISSSCTERIFHWALLRLRERSEETNKAAEVDQITHDSLSEAANAIIDSWNGPIADKLVLTLAMPKFSIGPTADDTVDSALAKLSDTEVSMLCKHVQFFIGGIPREPRLLDLRDAKGEWSGRNQYSRRQRLPDAEKTLENPGISAHFALARVFSEICESLEEKDQRAFDFMFFMIPALRSVVTTELGTMMSDDLEKAATSWERLNDAQVISLGKRLEDTPSRATFVALKNAFSPEKLTDGSEVPRRHVEIIVSLLRQLTTCTAYELFTAVCTEIAEFNLREFVLNVSHRHALAFLVTLAWKDELYNPGPNVMSANSIAVAAAEENESDTRKKYLAKLSGVTKEYPGLFDRLVSDLRLLTSEQLQAVMDCMYRLLTATALGEFFWKYEKFRQENAPDKLSHFTQRLVECELCCTVRTHAGLRFNALRDNLSFFDFNRLTTLAQPEKEVALGRYLSNEALVAAACKWDSTRLQQTLARAFTAFSRAGTNPSLVDRPLRRATSQDKQSRSYRFGKRKALLMTARAEAAVH